MNLIWGYAGILSYNELDNYKKSLEENISELNSINGRLGLESEKLIHQKGDIVIQARELGWLAENEGFIHIRGYKKNNSAYSMGRLLSADKDSTDNNNSIVMAAVLFGLLFYVGTSLIHSLRLKK